MAPLLLLALSSLLLGESLASQKVVSLPIRHGRKNWLNATAPSNDKRAASNPEPFDVDLENLLAGHQYFAIAGIGSPAQTLEILIDTGSSDTWVFEKNACKASSSGPCIGGEFNPKASSTFKNLRSTLGQYSNRYGDGSQVSGPFFSDKFSIGDATVSGLTMGLVNRAKGIIREGLMGVGYASNEGTVAYGNKPYPNLPEVLVQQGLISTRAYSLYLDDIADSTGSVLFGGYDTDKFSGEIAMLPIQNDPLTGRRDAFYVPLTRIAISLTHQTAAISSDHDPYPIPVLLDSGTENIQIPLELFEPFVAAFRLKALASGTKGLFSPFQIPCKGAESGRDAYVVFAFGTRTVISVPLQELIVPLYDPKTGKQIRLRNGTPFCRFGISAAPPGSPIILGQTFLRSAYALYDLDNFYVGLAQATLNKNSSNVIEYTGNGNMQSIRFDTRAPTAQTVNYQAKTYIEHLTASPSIMRLATGFPVSVPNMAIPTSVPPTPSSSSPSSNDEGTAAGGGGSGGGSGAASLPSTPVTSIWLIVATTIFGSLLGGVYLL